MSSRRGRLNWSNLEIHISDEAINKQHHFTATNSISGEYTIEEEHDTKSMTKETLPIKQGWTPKRDVGEIQIEHFVGNFMLTNAEQTAIDKKYVQSSKKSELSKVPLTETSKSIRISNRLSTNGDTTISIRTTNLTVGQHLFNVFICHVELFSCVYIMFGDDYDRATRLFQDMNTCDELLQPATSVFEPKEKDLVALYHEKKWFRGQCLSATNTSVSVLCIDSGAIINCSRHDLRRLPERFRIYPACCIECFLEGLPSTISMNSIPASIRSECFELLYKDRYEAIVTKLQSENRPTIVLYYANENVNDCLLKILKLI